MLLALALMMVADYLLTVVGAHWRERGYHRHFVVEDYELNPAFQAEIRQRRWFSPRHSLAVVLVVAALWGLEQVAPPLAMEMLYGGVFGVYAIVIGRHLGNLAQFSRAAQHPEDLSGRLEVSYRWLLAASASQLVGPILLALVWGWMAPSLFGMGVLCGLCALLVTHLLWTWQAGRREPTG